MMRRLTDQDIMLSSNADLIQQATAIILPGVGSFDEVMKKLHNANLLPALSEAILIQKTPFLGICVGMQVLFSSSEEGQVEGLSWIEGVVRKFKFDDEMNQQLKIPHMGWNVLSRTQKFAAPTSKNERFYFVHSYHVDNVPDEYVLAHTHYGYDFPSIVKKDNIWGIQFHPEKSHIFGMDIFRFFLENRG